MDEKASVADGLKLAQEALARVGPGQGMSGKQRRILAATHDLLAGLYQRSDLGKWDMYALGNFISHRVEGELLYAVLLEHWNGVIETIKNSEHIQPAELAARELKKIFLESPASAQRLEHPRQLQNDFELGVAQITVPTFTVMRPKSIWVLLFMIWAVAGLVLWLFIDQLGHAIDPTGTIRFGQLLLPVDLGIGALLYFLLRRSTDPALLDHQKRIANVWLQSVYGLRLTEAQVTNLATIKPIPFFLSRHNLKAISEQAHMQPGMKHGHLIIAIDRSNLPLLMRYNGAIRSYEFVQQLTQPVVPPKPPAEPLDSASSVQAGAREDRLKLEERLQDRTVLLLKGIRQDPNLTSQLSLGQLWLSYQSGSLIKLMNEATVWASYQLGKFPQIEAQMLDLASESFEPAGTAFGSITETLDKLGRAAGLPFGEEEPKRMLRFVLEAMANGSVDTFRGASLLISHDGWRDDSVEEPEALSALKEAYWTLTEYEDGLIRLPDALDATQQVRDYEQRLAEHSSDRRDAPVLENLWDRLPTDIDQQELRQHLQELLWMIQAWKLKDPSVGILAVTNKAMDFQLRRLNYAVDFGFEYKGIYDAAGDLDALYAYDVNYEGPADRPDYISGVSLLERETRVLLAQLRKS